MSSDAPGLARRDKRAQRSGPDPPGRPSHKGSGGRYVLHKHAASQLHYDLRLEENGVLRSWALPKGPSLEIGEKRLAVEVEDHPLSYGDFEGVIAREKYGGGTVMVWDRGQWMRCKGSTADKIDFNLLGEKLQGGWSLVRMHETSGKDKKKNDWLLIRRHAGEGRMAEIKALDLLDDHSVLSGRSMERIAAEGTHDSHDGKQSPPDPSAYSGARKQKLARTIRPQLATLVKDAPTDDDWLQEAKLDGYRLLALVQNGRAHLLTRNDNDWTERFPHLAATVEMLPVNEALLDGEIVKFGPAGISDFGQLQEAMSSSNTGTVVYLAFDLLHLDGYTLMPVAQRDRKQMLAQLLACYRNARDDDDDGALRYVDHVKGTANAFFDRACDMGLEGIMCKHVDGTYTSGRNRHWLKMKCARRDEFVVGGFTEPNGGRIGFGALLLGAFGAADKLVYCGRVGTGFTDRQLEGLSRTLRQTERETSPFAETVPNAGSAHWVRPELVIEVQYTRQTRDRRLRHPTFRGLREDKNVTDVRPPKQSKALSSKRASQQSAARQPHNGVTVAGVKLTHPQRVMYPDMGVTKLDLARHFEAIQEWIIPALMDRPVSLLRCPEGSKNACFFQKHPGSAIPADVPRVAIKEKNGTHDYACVRTIGDLITLVQAGTLELHVGNSRIDDIERPDCLVFDLDPGPDVPWKDTLRAAHGLDERLENLGLASFVRTIGGKGLHLVVPLIRTLEWAGVKAFAHAVARQYAQTDPEHLTTNMAKDKRHGKIFIDYLRNSRGATAIASYSPRARPGAPVAVPLRWDELGTRLKSDRYTLGSVRHRLAALKHDPWADFAAARRPLTKAMQSAVDIADDD